MAEDFRSAADEWLAKRKVERDAEVAEQLDRDRVNTERYLQNAADEAARRKAAGEPVTP